MIQGLSKAVTLYLAPLLMLTTILLSLFAFLAPVLMLHDRVALLTVFPSTELVQAGPSNGVDGPSLFLGPLGSCSKPNNAGQINCTSPTISPVYDLSDLPASAPHLLLSAPTATTPIFMAMALSCSIIFFFTFIMISFRHKMGEKMTAALDKPIVQRLSAWVGFFGFLIGLTSFLIVRMWFGKAVQDFNNSIMAQGPQGPKLVANTGNAFTMVWVAYAFYAVPLISSLTKLNLLQVVVAVTFVAAADIDIVRDRRYSIIVGSTTGATSIANWLSSLDSTGKWPDVDYTTGCPAQTSSWPAQTHWSRINTMAAGWHGGFRNADQWTQNSDIRAAISRAMNFWFTNDFTNAACLDSGGQSACPCGTAGLWNTNWFSNVILIPGWVGQVCLLLGNSLSASETTGCTRMTNRAFNTFTTGINGVSAITGANALDIASIGIDLALFTNNAALLSDALNRVNAEVVFQNGIKADGIRSDGSFGQHAGILYNGNYGKDYTNDVLNIELATAGTQFQASSDSMNAFSTLIGANQWMIFRNIISNVLHWDFSVLGRFIVLPVSDNQATANIKTNLTQLQVLGQTWNSPTITSVFNALNSGSTSANVGPLVGNRMFFANDYMVHRGPGYVTTLKMFSRRTQNTECSNSQNPFGFHLSDGTLYTYLQGNEYEDITAAWDWNLIPGTTVDYGATPLDCSSARKTGTQPLVGGASDGSVGVAAMRYETPTTRTLNWRKTWFFLENDVQFVMVARVESTTSAPVFSVLDQRRRSGDVFVDGASQNNGGNFTGVASLWHGGVGYTFNTTNPTTSLSLQLGPRTGSWSSISASSAPPVTVDLFAAWLSHNDIASAISYAIYPGTASNAAFLQKVAATQIRSIRNDGSISALLDVNHRTAMVVYWVAAGGSVSIPSTTSGIAPITIASNGNANLILHMDNWSVTLSDPSQTLTSVTVTFTLGSGTAPAGWGSNRSKSLAFTLPSGGDAGKSVTQTLPN
ncbi:hypothetical protein ONZ45_g913 [Pleurotus djamor]|nr:hypothetical protein ONZ45_g913 [Pleurotus djamor]